MDLSSPIRWFALAAGLLIGAEALALLIGMRLLNGCANPWNTPRNDLLLALDLFCGASLIILSLRDGAFPLIFLWAALFIALLTHLYRSYESLAHFAHPICANSWLFAVNTLKQLLVLVTSGRFIRRR